MFKKKFSDEIKNIKATDESKATLLKKIEQEKIALVPTKKSVKKRWISAIAAALTLVIVSVTAFNLSPFGKGKIVNITAEETIENSVVETVTVDGLEFPVINSQKGIPASVTHNQIYTLFSSIYEVEHSRGIITDGALYEDDFEFYEEYADDVIDEDVIDEDVNLNGGNTTAKPNSGNATKGENTSPTLDSASPDDVEGDTADEEDYSTTNVQVENVDEADIVKTDGKYIYTLISKNLEVQITAAKNGKLSNITSFDVFKGLLDEEKFYRKYYGKADMYLCGDRLLIVLEKYFAEYNKDFTLVEVFDISNKKTPTLVREVSQSGTYLSSRVIDNKLYIFTNEYIYKKPTKDDKNTYLPCTSVDGEKPVAVNEGSIYMFDGEVNRSYLTVSSVDVNDGEIIDTKTALGGGSTLYANTKGFYVTADDCNVSYLTGDMQAYYDNKTRIIRFEINDGKITAMAEGFVEGKPLNQFSMDEYGDHFRIVTTGYAGNFNTTNAVYVLDKELKVVGKITDIANGERVYSVRFMGDIGYFVTFRQVDPLFAVDFKDPKKPKILSALKIPGFSNYMHPWGDGLLLGIGADADERTGVIGGVKLSMFDISNPEKVSEKSKEIVEVLNAADIGTNHKEILADFSKNLIGFATRTGKYYLYGYSKDKGFEQKAVLKVQREIDSQGNDDYYYYDCYDARGIYIGEYFYVCSAVGINSYKLSDFSEVDSLMFI